MPSCPLCEEFILGTDALVVHLHLEHREFQVQPFSMYADDPKQCTYGTGCPCGWTSGVPVSVNKAHVQSFRFATLDLHDHLITNGGIEQHIKEALVRKALSEDAPRSPWSAPWKTFPSAAGVIGFHGIFDELNGSSNQLQVAFAHHFWREIFSDVAPYTPPKYIARFKDLP